MIERRDSAGAASWTGLRPGQAATLPRSPARLFRAPVVAGCDGNETGLTFAAEGMAVPLIVVRRARMKGLRLVVDRHGARLRLSLPPRAALGPALAWVESQRVWIAARLGAVPQPEPIEPGMIIPWLGRGLRLEWAADRARIPVWRQDELIIGGPRESLSARVLRGLKVEAQAWLERETRVLATAHGLEVSRVSIGDPRSRWGSCTDAGAIRYSWRLMLAPEAVARATIGHELAHRRHMNHGPAFHRFVSELLGRDPHQERAWLRAHGARLHAFGRETGEAAPVARITGP